MYCEECQKRLASVSLTIIVNGKKIEKHLCEQCARKQQAQFGFNLTPDLSLTNFISSMLDSDVFTSLGGISRKQLKCEKCSMDYNYFAKKGRLGCNECYEIFKDSLDSLLKRIHGNTRHTGKIPKRSGEDIKIKQEIKNARLKLQEAVLNEEFEKAAMLRDTIRDLEKKEKDKGGSTND